MPDPIQAPAGYTTANNTTEDLSGTVGSFDATVTAGSLLIAIVQDTTSNNRTYNIYDSSDSYTAAWTKLTQATSPGSRSAVIMYYEGHPGGTVTIRTTASAATIRRVQLLEVSARTFDASSTISSASTGVDATNGYPASADATVIDTAANVFVVTAVTLDANATTLSASSGYTALHGNQQYRAAYRESASALTNERGWINETGTDRSFCGTVASWAAAGGGATPKGVFGKALYGPLRRVIM